MTPAVDVRQTLTLMAEGLKEVTAEKDILIQEKQKMADDLQKLNKKLQAKEASFSVARDQVADKDHKISALTAENEKIKRDMTRCRNKADGINQLNSDKEADIKKLKGEKKAADAMVAKVQVLGALKLNTAIKQKESLMKNKDNEIQDLKTQFSNLREEQERLTKEKDDKIQLLIEEISNQKGLLEGEKVKTEKLLEDLFGNVANAFQKFQEGMNQPSFTTTTANITPPPQLQPPQAQPPTDPRQQRPRPSSAGPHNTGATQARNNDAPLPRPTVSVATTTAKRNLAQELSRTDQKNRPADKEEGEIGTYRRDKKRQTCAANDTRPGKDRRH
jgi:myosin heavy subunit